MPHSNFCTILLFYSILIMTMLYMIQPQKPLSPHSKNFKLEQLNKYLVLGLEQIETIYKSLDLLSLQHRRDFHKCILVCKCHNNLAPSYLVDMFNSNDSVHSYNTRHASQLRSTKNRTAHYHQSFTVSSHKLWNDLPSKIQNCTTLPSFKNALYRLYFTKTQF